MSALFSLSTQVFAASHSGDVEWIDPKSIATGDVAAKNAVASTRIGNVYVVDVTGDYSRGNTAPRQSVGQSFFQTHVDDYDFLIVFTTFEFETGDFRAFYNPVRNDTSGIGRAQFDSSAAFGSAGRLQGFIDMAATTRYSLNPADAAYDEVLDTFAHELMHRWGVFANYRTDTGAVANDLLGREGAHWSYFVDSDASVMEGAEWRQLPDGRFEVVDRRRRYNDVELYLAGFKSAGEVQPIAVIRGGIGSPNDLPRIGATTPGQLELVTLQQIIDHEGPRVPSVLDSPKDFHAALLLLRRPGEAIDPTLLTQLERFRIAAQHRFAQFTQGRAMLRIDLQSRGTAQAGLPEIVHGTGQASTPGGTSAAVAWLKSRQFEDGHWQDRPSTAVRDTATALEALQELEPGYEGIPRARAWLASRGSLATADRAWRLAALPSSAADFAALGEAQLANGGFGLDRGWQGTPADSIAAVRVLSARSSSRSQALLAARYLTASQLDSGGVPAARGGRPLIGQTAELATILHALDPIEFAPAITRARAWVASHGDDGGFGDEAATIADSATVLRAQEVLALPALDVNELRAYLQREQQVGGDWAGSVYATASTLLAQGRDQRANLAFASPIAYAPAPAVDGDIVRLSAEVVNTGTVPTSVVHARWVDGDPDGSGVTIDVPVTIPVLSAGASTTARAEWNTLDRAGAHQVWLVLDADNEATESNEADNRSSTTIVVAAPSAQADLVPDASATALDPSTVENLPARVTLHAVVRNIGQAETGPTLLRLQARKGQVLRTLAERTIALAGRSTQSFELEFDVDDAALTGFELLLDPGGAVAEANEQNNRLSLSLPIGRSIDLAIATDDLELVGNAIVGSDATLRATVRNLGTVDAPAFAMRAGVLQDGNRYELGTLQLPLPAGQSQQRTFNWRVAAAGPAVFEIALDPDSAIVEANEANNVATLAFTAGTSDEPNLQVVFGSVAVTPSPALEGSPLSVHAIARNVGGGSAGASVAKLYDADPRSGGRLLAQSAVSPIASGADAPIDLGIADFPGSGDVTLHLIVDADEQVTESVETDNLAVRAINALKLPDIAVRLAGIRLTPALPVPGEPVQARVTVSNIGGQPATAIAVSLREGTPQLGVDIAPPQVVPTLAPGAETELTWNWTFGLQPDATAVTATVDPGDAIREGSNDNNQAVLPIATQDDALFASERYISPDGNGIQDEVAVVFRLEGIAEPRVEVRNAFGAVVRRFASDITQSNGRAQVIWDGRDRRGRIVPDGDYRVVVIDSGGAERGALFVTVDLNRSSPLEAIGGLYETYLELPRGVAQWKPAAATGRYRNAVFGTGWRNLPAEGPAGLFWTDTLFPALQTILSSRWVEAYGRSLNLDAQITGFAVTPDGESVLVAVTVVDTVNVGHSALFRARIGSTDSPELVTEQLPRMTNAVIGFFGPDRAFVGQDGYAPWWNVVTLSSGSVVPFRQEIGGGEILAVFDDGLLLGTARGASVVPGAFVPADTAQPVVAPVLPYFEGEIQVVPNHDRSRWGFAYARKTSETHDYVSLLDVRTGQFRLLLDSARESVTTPTLCDNDSGPEPCPPIEAVGHVRIAWLRDPEQLVLLDGLARKIERFDAEGNLVASASLGALGRTGAYEGFGTFERYLHAFGTVRGETPEAGSCNADIDWRSFSDDHRFFDPARESLFASTNELVMAFHDDGSFGALGYAEGAVEYHRIDFETEAATRLRQGTATPLRNPTDRTLFPFLGPCAANRPDDWPQWILADGSRIRTDGRLEIPASGVSAAEWARAGRVLSIWRDDTRLVLDDESAPGTVRAIQGSMLNLEARLVPQPLDRAIALSGVATDRNFQYYALDYSLADGPATWQAIVPPSREEVFADEFLHWVPPQPGDYVIRLRVVDRAGNTNDAFARATSDYGSPLREMVVEPRYISPNADGVQDELVARFRVAEAATVDFVVRDAQRRIVRTITRVYGSADVGPDELRWDGRNDGGQVVTDGTYRFEAAGWRFTAIVDSAPPTVSADAERVYQKKKRNPSQYDVAIDARIAFCAEDQNPEVVTVEGQPEAGGEWVELRQANFDCPAHAPDGQGSSKRYIPLPVSNYPGFRYRLLARDRAGNHNIADAGLVEQDTVALAVSDPTNGDRTIVTYADPPERHAAGDPIMLQQGDETALAAFVGVKAPAFVDVELRDRASVDGWRVVSHTAWAAPACSDDDCIRTGMSRVFAAPLATAELAIDSPFVGRAVTIAADSRRVPSNEFPLLIGGFVAPSCTLFQRNPPVLEAQFLAMLGLGPNDGDLLFVAKELYAGRLSAATLVVREFEGGPVIARIRAAAFTDDGVAFRLPSFGARRPGPVEIQAVTSAGRNVRGFGVIGCNVVSRDLIDAQPVLSADCAATPTDRVALSIAHPNGPVGRLCYLDPQTGLRDCSLPLQDLSSEVASGELDTSGMPEGVLPVEAERQVAGSWSVYATGSVPIDHTPVTVRLDAPGSGSRVCGRSRVDEPSNAVIGAASDASAMSWRIETRQEGHPVWECRWSDGEIAAPTAGCPARRGVQGTTRIGALGELDATFDRLHNGPLQLRVRATDWSGADVCANTELEYDLDADLVERAAPSTLAPNGLSLWLTTTGFPQYREIVLRLQAREPLRVRHSLHAWRVGATGLLEIDPEPVAILRDEYEQARGAFDFRWDGRVAGDAWPDGRYVVRTTAADDCGHEKRLDRDLFLDSTPPDVHILQPQVNGIASGATVDVFGTIDDDHLDDWELSVALPTQPDAWNPIALGARAVSANAPMGRWQRLPNPAQSATLRIEAFDRLGNSTDYRHPVQLGPGGELIQAVEADPPFLSPNNDQVQDATRVAVSLRRSARVRLRVLDAQQSLVAELSPGTQPIEGSPSWSWNGRYGTGNVVPDGVYALEVFASDSIGAVQETVTISVVVDATAPVLELVAPVGEFGRDDDEASVRIDEANHRDGAIRLVSVATGAEVASLAPRGPGTHLLAPLRSLAEQRYRVEAAVEDLAGNRASLAREFEVDRTKPVVAITDPVGSSVLRRGVGRPIAGTAVDAHLARYTLATSPQDGAAAWTNVATGSESVADGALGAWTPLVADGLHRLRLVAEDAAGNTNEVEVLVGVDGTPPTVAIDEPQESALVTRMVDVVGTLSDEFFDRASLAIADATSAAQDAFNELRGNLFQVDHDVIATLALAVPDGDYVLRLSARDVAGNEAQVRRRVRVDTLPPSPPTALTARTIQNRDVDLTWTASTSADVAGYRIVRNGAALDAALVTGTAFSDIGAPEGRIRYTVRAVDQAGNESAPSNIAEAVVDHTPPIVALRSPVAGERVAGRLPIVGTAFSSNDFAEYRVFQVALPAATDRVLIARGTAPLRDDVLAQWDTSATANEIAVRILLESEDRSGNVATAQADVVVDNQAPSVPTGLAAVLEDPHARASWNPNPEADLLGYLLYRDGVLLNAAVTLPVDLRPFAIAASTWLDTSIGDGAHEYRLRAIDRAGNVSGWSAPVALLREAGPPHLFIVEPDAGRAFESSVRVVADSNDRDIATVQFAYRAAAGGDWVPIGAPLTERSFVVEWSPAPLPYGEYDIRAVATDDGALVDVDPPVVRVRFADLTAPPRVASLGALADGGDVALAWDASVAPDLAGYVVERLAAHGLGDWEAVTATPLAANTFTDVALADDDYLYRVFAVDASGNRAAASPIANARVFTPQIDVPFTPTRQATTTIAGRSPVAGIAEVELVLGGASTAGPSVATDAEGAFTLMGVVLAVGENELRVRVRDAAGNRSRAAIAVVDHGTVPAAPTGLTAIPAGQRVALAWNASPEPDIVGYRLFRNDRPVLADANVSSADLVVSATYGGDAANAVDADPDSAWMPAAPCLPACPPGLTLDIGWAGPRLVAAANLAWSSASSRATSVDAYAWSGREWVKVAELRGASGTSASLPFAVPYRTTRIRLAFLAAADDGSGTLSLADAVVVERPLATSTTYEDDVTDGRHRYRVSAVNAFGFEGERSTEAVAEVGDSIAPDPVVLSGSATASDATLSWTASVATDVARYELQRDGQSIASVAASDVRQYVDRNVPNGTHAWLVFAYDAFDNESAPSNVVTLAIESAGPGVPTALVVSQTGIGGTLDLHWSAGSGAPPSRYVVRRAPSATGPYTQVANVATTAWRDVGLVDGTTYWYTVEALDAAGNSSGPSAPASGTPADRDPPAAPVLTHPASAGVAVEVPEATVEVCGNAMPGSLVDLRANGTFATAATARTGDVDYATPAGWARDFVLVAPDARHALLQNGSGQPALFDLRSRTESPLVLTGNSLAWGWSPRGESLYRYDGAAIVQRDLVDAQEYRVLYGVDSLRAMAIAPDRRHLLLAGALDGAPAAVSVAELYGSPWTLDGLDEPSARVDLAEWSPDSTRVALLTTSGELFVVGTAQSPVVPTRSGVAMLPLRWSPDGAELLFATTDAGGATLVARNVATGGERAIVSLPATPVGFDWSPDGTRVAALVAGSLRTFDARTGVAIASTPFTTIAATGFAWSSTQQVVAWSTQGIRLREYAGGFCATVDLPQYENTVDAVARDAAGNRSLPSAALRIQVQNDQRPNLVLEDLVAVPAGSAPGVRHSIGFSIASQGSSDAPGATYDVMLTDPDGELHVVVANAAVPPLPANERHVVALDLGVLDEVGEYRVDVDVDADDAIDESNEADNAAAVAILVAPGGSPTLELTVAGATFAPGVSVPGQAIVAATGTPLTASMRLRILDAAGAQVAMLGTTQVAGLDPGQRLVVPWSWAATGIFAGEYQVEAMLFDRAGSLIAERRVPFGIAAQRNFSLRIASDRDAYTIGDPVRATVVAEFESGNAPLRGAVLEVVARDAVGAQVFRVERNLGTLLPGYALQLPITWATAARQPGVHRLVGTLHATSFEQSAERSVLLVAPGGGAVTGTISVAPGEDVILGRDSRAAYRVTNGLVQPVSDSFVRLRLLPATGGTALAERVEPLALAPGAVQTGELALSDLQVLGNFRLVLESRTAAEPDGWQLLATRTVRVADGLAPEIVPLRPAAGVVATGPATLSARIVDQHSAIAGAEARIDAGTWQPLGVQANGTWGRGNVAVAEGAHSLVIRARDSAGNEGESAPVTFIIDDTSPVIAIAGVADGEYASHDVAPSITVTDANPGTTQATLDGAAFVSGSIVASEGAHALVVNATDQAGNVATRAIAFTIDRTAPTMEFVVPADGSSTTQGTVDVLLQTEPAAEATLAVGAWSGHATADASGRAMLASVPLAPGANTLVASATDRAGNGSAAASIGVTRVIDVAAALAGDLQPSSSQVAHGDTLTIALSVLNRSGSARGGQQLRVRVTHAASGSVLGIELLQRDFAIGETVTASVAFATAAWPLGQVGVVLEAFDGGNWVALDAEAVEIIDAAPPSLLRLAPANGSFVQPPVRIAARATDALSLVTGVEARVDDDEWLPLDPTGNDEYEIAPVALPDGTHQVAFRARDAYANLAQLLPASFTVDGTLPEIDIAGVVDGEIRNTSATPVVTVIDANPDVLELTLNGMAWQSGTEVAADGDYVLGATAVDRAGNESRRSIVFTVDRTPPITTITSPVSGTVQAAPQATVVGTTEPLASVRISVGGFSSVVAADGVGAFSASGVPLEVGTNVIVAQGTDRAGNIGPSSSATVVREPNAGVAVAASLSPTEPEFAIGELARLQYTVTNTSSATASALPLRIDVRAAGNGTLLASSAFTFSGGPGESAAGTRDFPTDAWPAGAHRATLSSQIVLASGQPEWVEIGDAILTMADRTAPQLAIREPVPGAYFQDVVYVDVAASDAASPPVSVEAQLGDDPWSAIPAVGGGSYSARLRTTADGAIELRVRAHDMAGNVRASDPVVVYVDRIQAVILVEGLPANGLANSAVTPVIRVTDASPVGVASRLNGQPFTSGTPVSADGAYTLEVTAVDAAGNSSVATYSFAIDTTPPTTTIAYPSNGSLVDASNTLLVLHSEPGATISVTNGEYRSTIEADVRGDAHLDAVPLRVGPNVISAAARDRAGNAGIATQVTVIRRAASLATLTGTVAPNASSIRRPAQLLATVLLQNGGEQALSGLSVELTVIHVQSGQVLARRTQALELAAAGETGYVETFDTATWPTGTLTLRLSAAQPPASPQLLAERTVELRDAQLLALSVLQPANGATVTVPHVTVVARTVAGATVELRRGARTWAATADAAGIARIVDVELDLGENVVTLEARNSAGDRSAAVTWRLVRQGAAPAIPIPGLAPLGILLLLAGVLTAASLHRRDGGLR